MKEREAIKIAIKAIEGEMKKIVFEANLAQKGSTNQYHVDCLVKYEKCCNAITILEAMGKQPRLF